METPDPTTTHELAGPVGREMADALSEKVASAVEGFPSSSPEQRAAIARLIADNLYNRFEESS